MTFKTKGICATEINIELNNNIITSVKFIGGCNGNLKGIAALVEGMDKDDAITRLEGITCGPKTTSCPDQLASALKTM